MSILKILGRNIVKFRKIRNLTQEKLAEIIGLEPSSLSKIERGIVNPSPLTLEKIINALNIKPCLLYINDEENFNLEESYTRVISWIEELRNDENSFRIIYDFLEDMVKYHKN